MDRSAAKLRDSDWNTISALGLSSWCDGRSTDGYLTLEKSVVQCDVCEACLLGLMPFLRQRRRSQQHAQCGDVHCQPYAQWIQCGQFSPTNNPNHFLSSFWFQILSKKGRSVIFQLSLIFYQNLMLCWKNHFNDFSDVCKQQFYKEYLSNMHELSKNRMVPKISNFHYLGLKEWKCAVVCYFQGFYSVVWQFRTSAFYCNVVTQIRWGGKWVHLSQFLPSFCQKSSNLVEIWQSSDK